MSIFRICFSYVLLCSVLSCAGIQATQNNTTSSSVTVEQEREAQEQLKRLEHAVRKNDLTTAKEIWMDFQQSYTHTQAYQKTRAYNAILAVINTPAPQTLDVEYWLQESATDINLQQGVTLLVFWEIWCPYCRVEIPKLQKTFETYGPKGLQMVGLTKLSRDKTKEEVMAFLGENKVTYPIAKETGALSQHFNVSGIPAGAIVKDGVIVWRGHPNSLSSKLLESLLSPSVME